MTRRSRALTLMPLALLLALACVTINVYFPEAEVKDLAEEIEKEIARRAAAQQSAPEAPAEPAPPAETKTPEGGVPSPGQVSLLDALFGMPAYAADVAEPAVTNPAIRKIIESRTARVRELDAFKAKGVIGEANDGTVVARSLESLGDLKERAAVQKIVRDENKDREALYREIAAATNVDPSQLGKVRETYAATLRANAKPGEWIQAPDGNWKQK